MKTVRWILMLFPITSVSLSAQNLVPNSGFESGGCPQGPGEIVLATSWMQPTFGTTDYFAACGDTFPLSVSVPLNMLGWQNARTGNAYAGFCAIDPQVNYSYREYMQTQLAAPLQAGTRYYVRFYVALADCVSYATDDIGVYFSATAISQMHDSTLNLTPQVSNPEGNVITDKVYWSLIQGSFIAAGGEQFMTIGNFKNDQNTDLQFLSWNFWSAAYYYVDDICVSDDSLECELATVGDLNSSPYISLFPNPAVSALQIAYTPQTTEDVMIRIFDVTGKTVFVITSEIRDSGMFTQSISVMALPDGIYTMELVNGEAIVRRKFIVKR